MVDRERSGEPGFVRDATAADASAIAEVQRVCWRHDYSWPEDVFRTLEESDAELAWTRAVIAPPGPGFRLLVATSGSEVVGFVALAPSQDADATGETAEISVWEVRPSDRGRGHASRLLAAAADHARSVGARELTIWIAPSDDARHHVLRTAGFGPDGAHREIALDTSPDVGDDDGVSERQIRMATLL